VLSLGEGRRSLLVYGQDEFMPRFRPGWAVVCGVGFASAGALAGVILGKSHYVWAGVVIGAVTGAFAPLLVDTLVRRSRDRGALEWRGTWPVICSVRPDCWTRGPTLSTLLAVVSSWPRLRVWCDDAAAGRLRLVTGPGGVGKTRLALRLSSEKQEWGWRCEPVGDGEEATKVQQVRAVTQGRVLLVVDYAETRIGLPELLRAVATDDGERLRVLLLARSAGEWWERLGVGEPAVRALVRSGSVHLPLSPVVDELVSDDELVRQAVRSFAERLRVPAPADVNVVEGPVRARILDLHAAALIGVLRAQAVGSTAPVQVRLDDVLAELLDHEERFWMGSAQAAGLLTGPHGMTVTTLRQLVAACALLGASSEEDARDVLRRVPAAPNTPRVAGWPRDLYPALAALDWMGTLQPDQLAEELVVTQLAASPDFAERCLTDLDDRQARRAFTVLGRASTDQPAARPLLERLLPLLRNVVDNLDAPVETLIAIASAIPYPSLSLADAHLAISRRIIATFASDTSPAMRATWLNMLGMSLAQVGRPAEALPPTEEAVGVYRELAEAYPDRYRPDLALSLSNLGVAFSALGRPAEALPPTEEAVGVYRELAEAYPDRYRPDLALSLSNLGVAFSALGRPAEALPPTEEAVGVYRELAEAYPDRYRPDLAASLSNLGIRLSELGWPAEAAEVQQEAKRLRQSLADT
jgi:tetratricopeptide (TPR) repeat protein